MDVIIHFSSFHTRVYGYAYPFIELALGVAYLVRLAPLVTNLVTLAVMLVGAVGVTQALLQKRRIQCACLGKERQLFITFDCAEKDWQANADTLARILLSLDPGQSKGTGKR